MQYLQRLSSLLFHASNERKIDLHFIANDSLSSGLVKQFYSAFCWDKRVLQSDIKRPAPWGIKCYFAMVLGTSLT